ncbi:MAG TPA: hypothetical protein QGH16_05145 [Verrucomicrobiota bacterium]|nr:hypothetical protein [Verrucomicrobiota bacterium]
MPEPPDWFKPLKTALARAWQTAAQANPPDTDSILELAKRKYSEPDWINQRS